MKLLFSSALAFVKGRANLVFGYALIAALITLGGFTTALWIKNVNMKTNVSKLETNLLTTKATVATLELAKATQDRTIKDLQDLRIKDSEALTGLQNDVTTIRGQDNRDRNKIKQLENQNEKVYEYLNTTLPPELQCVLNNDCQTGTSGGTTGPGSTRSPAKRPDNPVRGTGRP